MRLLVGTSKAAFYEVNFNETACTLESSHTITSPAPAWLCLNDDELYVVGEIEGHPGKLSRFVLCNDTWKKQWTKDSSSEGTCHCCVAVHDGNQFVLSANYVGHTVDVHDSHGQLLSSVQFHGSGPFESRQESSHCHQIAQDLRLQYIYVNDLGGDVTHRYILNKQGNLVPHGRATYTPGQGPRHTAFNSAFPTLTYTICELSNEIVIHQWAEGASVLQQKSILPDPSRSSEKNERYPQPASAGEIQITKDGKFLYASTRYLPDYKSDTILCARLDEHGLMGSVHHLDTGAIAPWHFSLSYDERYLAVAFKDSNLIRLYQRREDGSLMLVCQTDKIESPSCVLCI